MYEKKFGTEVCKGLPKHKDKKYPIKISKQNTVNIKSKIHCDCEVITNYRLGDFILSHPVIIVCQLTARLLYCI